MNTDEMKELVNLFGEKPTVGLREKARPTFTLGPEGKTCKTCEHAVQIRSPPRDREHWEVLK